MSTTNEISSTAETPSLSPSQETEVVTQDGMMITEKEPSPQNPDGEMEVSKEGRGASNGGVRASTDDEDEMKYPTGLILVAIVSSVMMTVFLIALDQVSSRTLTFSSSCLIQVRQLLVPQFLKSPTSFTALLKYHGTALRTS